MRLLQKARKQLANVASGGELERLSGSTRNLYAQLKENSREIARLKEDAQWVPVGTQQATIKRETMRAKCRAAYQRNDAFVKGALRLMTEFVFEQGVDGPVSNDERPEVQVALDEFWFAPDNQEALFCTVAQHRASSQLLVDGDYFAMVRTAAAVNKHVAVRYMPANYVVDVITDPFDVVRALYYKCSVPDLEWDEGDNSWKPKDVPKTVFYRDIFNIDPENDPLRDKLGAAAVADAWLQHIAINAIDAASFGWPEPAVSLRWFEGHREIVEDQITISRMTAALMTMLKVSADAAAIQTLQDQITERGQYEGSESNENLPGQVNILNEQAELSVNRASTGATDADANGRMLRMGGAAGLNLPMHYQADPFNANLATARSMDRPSLVHMRAYQSVWIDAYRKLIDFYLAWRGIEDAKYDIPAPRIARQDIGESGKLIIDAYDDGLLTGTQAASSVLDMLGFDDIAGELAAREEEMEAEEDAEVTPLETEPEEDSEW